MWVDDRFLKLERFVAATDCYRLWPSHASFALPLRPSISISLWYYLEYRPTGPSGNWFSSPNLPPLRESRLAAV
jgi:hypothetical protein